MKNTVFAALGVIALALLLSTTVFGNKTSDQADGSTSSVEAEGDLQPQAEKSKQPPSSFDKMPAPGTKAYCPVMKAEFEVREDSASSTYKGKHYVFCCPGCKKMFDADPKKYI